MCPQRRFRFRVQASERRRVSIELKIWKHEQQEYILSFTSCITIWYGRNLKVETFLKRCHNTSRLISQAQTCKNVPQVLGKQTPWSLACFLQLFLFPKKSQLARRWFRILSFDLICLMSPGIFHICLLNLCNQCELCLRPHRVCCRACSVCRGLQGEMALSRQPW